MSKPSEIWREVKPKIGEMLAEINNMESRCEKVREEAHANGWNAGSKAVQEETWDIAKRIICREEDDGLSGDDLHEIFGWRSPGLILHKFTAEEAAARIHGWEVKKEEKQTVEKRINTQACSEKTLTQAEHGTLLSPCNGSDIEVVKEAAYQRGLADGREESREAITNLTRQNFKDYADMYDSGYWEGLKDAWECARKITCYPIEGGMECSDLQIAFNVDDVDTIMKRFSASEAIEKIRVYEQRTKEDLYARIAEGLDDLAKRCNVTFAEIAEALHETIRETNAKIDVG